MGIVAETHPDFHIAFFAARRAALVPVPLPASIHMGGTAPFIELLGRLLRHADAKVALATEAFLPYLRDAAAADTQIPVQTIAGLLAGSQGALPRLPGPDDRLCTVHLWEHPFPRERADGGATLRNVQGIIRDGLKITERDRFCSWLPIYHDMGLVGKVMVPMASQTSITLLRSSPCVPASGPA